MTNNKECFVFKDLYEAYINDEVEEETAFWMEEHMECCSGCKLFAEEHNQKKQLGDEQNSSAYSENVEFDDEACSKNDKSEKAVLRRATIMTAVGMAVVVVIAIWMSLWIFD